MYFIEYHLLIHICAIKSLLFINYLSFSFSHHIHRIYCNFVVITIIITLIVVIIIMNIMKIILIDIKISGVSVNLALICDKIKFTHGWWLFEIEFFFVCVCCLLFDNIQVYTSLATVQATVIVDRVGGILNTDPYLIILQCQCINQFIHL